MASDLVAVENRLWATADQLWANTGLKPSEFSTPVLGLIFLRHADKRFTQVEAALTAKGIPADEREAMDYHAEGVLYLPLESRISYLVTLVGADRPGRSHQRQLQNSPVELFLGQNKCSLAAFVARPAVVRGLGIPVQS